MFLSSFLLAKLFQRHQKSLNLNQFKKHVESFDCLSSGVSNYLTRVGYNIDWHLNKKILTKAVDDYARDWSKREGCHVSALVAWLETIKHQQQDKQFRTSKLSSLS